MGKEMVLSDDRYRKLLGDLRTLIDEGRAKAQAAANWEILLTYWRVGKRITDEHLTENSGYGQSIMERLAGELRTDRSTLVRCRWFHEYYPGGPPKGTELSWSHYRELLTLKDEKARAYYERLAEEKDWTRDQLVKAIKADKVVTDDPTKNGKKAPQLKRPGAGPFIFRAEVLKCVDGDSLWTRLDLGFDVWKKVRIRLAAIDTPELKADGGEEAFAYVRDQMAKAKVITIRTGKEDLHGRFVGHIFYSLDERDDWEKVYREGRFLNQELLDLGLARVY